MSFNNNVVADFFYSVSEIVKVVAIKLMQAVYNHTMHNVFKNTHLSFMLYYLLKILRFAQKFQ